MTIDVQEKVADQVRLNRVRKGDEEAFEKFFKAYNAYLTNFAWQFLGSRAIAEELVQDLFADIWENRETWPCVGELRPYLYRIIKEKCLNCLKRQKIRNKYDGQWMEQWGSASNAFDEHERDQEARMVSRIVFNAVENLPYRSKITYKLNKYDGLTYPEIAVVMNLPLKTVESRMARALKLLRQRLAYLGPFIIAVVFV
ncbi:MAG: RNA polymerase sigma-70 factor [Balneolales bacterium]